MNSKEYVLELLESRRGQSISGEYIAEQLKVSRNAVWKAVKELEKEGYKITAIPNKGYCLSEDNDIVSVQGMLPYLRDRKAFENIFVYDCLESANQTAKEMALSGVPHGTVVIADRQTAGKGRYGRKFHSPPGNGIYMSLILCPTQLGFSSPTLITASTAVSVCEAIEAVSDKKPQIKWVNDIFIDRKKICGILTEAVMDFESGITQWIVVGIGINFSRPEGNFPQDLQEVAGTVFEESNPPTTRNHLIAEVVNRMVFSEGGYGDTEMLAHYKQRMFMLGERVSVTRGSEQFEAVALDIDQGGQLIVRADGEVLSLTAGEVRVRPQ